MYSMSQKKSHFKSLKLLKSKKKNLLEFETADYRNNALSLSLCNAGQVPVNVLVIMLISPVSSETAAYFVWSRGTYIAYAKTTATEKMSRH